MTRNCLRLCGVALVAFACGKDGTGPAPVLIDIQPVAVTLIVGHHTQLSARLFGANGDTLRNRAVTWTSSNPTKVTVSPTGLVTGLALADSVVITAQSQSVVGQAIVYVVLDLSGEWNFSEHATWAHSSGAWTCEHTGSFQFAQSDFDFSGTTTGLLTCTAPLQSADLSNMAWPGDLTQFQLSAAKIDFNYGGCVYGGTISVAQPPLLAGTVSCTSGYAGNWQASQGGAPVDAVSVRGGVATVVAGAAQLVAVPVDAAGHVLQRAVMWTSENESVARVSSTGLVTTLTAGSVRITASSEGRSGSTTVTVDPVNLTWLSAGVWHSCALTTAGKAYCWGWGGDGQLGTSFRAFALAPIESDQSPDAVSGGYAFRQLDAGQVGHGCAVTTDSEAYCWGDNAWGQLGDGSTASKLAPSRVAGAEVYASVTAGWQHSCGLTSSGAAFCWGSNEFGQLGNGSLANSSSPVAVAGALTFRILSAGDQHTCGITADNLAYCWGLNRHGQLGDGSTTTNLAPVAVVGNHQFAVVGAGGRQSCGVALDGSAFCWGANSYGDLGDGSTSESSAPVAVSGGLTFATTAGTLAMGEDHTCALTTAGAAYCWGYNALGQLGDGSVSSRLTPVRVPGGMTFASLAAGGWHTCGATTGAVAWCWGLNANSQLGAAAGELCSGYSCSSLPIRVIGQPSAVSTLVARRVSSERVESPQTQSPKARRNTGVPAMVITPYHR
jgi:alpha-tubulin suppressor-like RCC1 family protein